MPLDCGTDKGHPLLLGFEGGSLALGGRWGKEGRWGPGRWLPQQPQQPQPGLMATARIQIQIHT